MGEKSAGIFSIDPSTTTAKSVVFFPYFYSMVAGIKKVSLVNQFVSKYTTMSMSIVCLKLSVFTAEDCVCTLNILQFVQVCIPLMYTNCASEGEGGGRVVGERQTR
jgi:hypothetical protein